jgi:hypothetical protein
MLKLFKTHRAKGKGINVIATHDSMILKDAIIDELTKAADQDNHLNAFIHQVTTGVTI